jgi:hypothetical protein
MLLDGEGFILQVHRVFTRIRSRAAVVVICGGAPGSTIYTEVQCALVADSRRDLLGMAASVWGEKP